MKNNVVVKELGGWDDVEILFEPGWSTGSQNGRFRDGVSISLKFSKPFTVGTMFSHRPLNRWNGGGIISKEDALQLANAIIEHYSSPTRPASPTN